MIVGHLGLGVAGIVEDQAGAASLVDSPALVDAGEEAAPAEDNLTRNGGRIEGAGRALLVASIFSVDQGQHSCAAGDRSAEVFGAAAQFDRALEGAVLGAGAHGGDPGHAGRSAYGVWSGTGVAGRGGNPDAGIGGKEIGDVVRAQQRRAAADGVVDDVNAVSDGAVNSGNDVR